MLRLSLTDRQVTADGRPLALSPAFFQLYCLLAYERACGRERFVTVRDVRRLSRWGRATPDSIGKSVHRHVRRAQRAGWDLIESPPRAATKLFRLKDAHVVFDAPLSAVESFLGLDLAVTTPSSSWPGGRSPAVDRMFRYPWAMVRARMELEPCDFAAARSLIGDAERVEGRPPRDRILLLLLTSSLLEQEGRFHEALAKAHDALSMCRAHGVDHLTHARACIRVGFLGAMLRQPHRYGEARDRYLEALRLLEGSQHLAELSQIATGLGHLARRAGDLDGALAYFVRALEYATAEAWGWGIQAGLFNLGLVQAERGDSLQDQRACRAAYLEARTWLERAVEFVGRTGIGRYSSEGLSVLAHVLLRLGQGRSAVAWARAALDRARAVRNRKSQAAALETVGEALCAIGARAEGIRALQDAYSEYGAMGFEPDARRVERLIAEARGRHGKHKG
ncbi:MAG: tetratricopeptide repeat protein [Armatimonadota bacterium]|nr:tetratricopeptide repeat protein [Armatimonadota bacterium]